jgi:hypothetical protein
MGVNRREGGRARGTLADRPLTLSGATPYADTKWMCPAFPEAASCSLTLSNPRNA